MEFSIQSIQTVAGCDALILMFNKEKADHEFRKLSLTRQYESLSENSSEDSAELTRISNELATITSIIGTLAPGEYQTDLISKKMKLESKKFDLENKVADYDIKAKFEKEQRHHRCGKSDRKCGCPLGCACYATSGTEFLIGSN
jgi:hypothetical protein